ncbi:hypothetical protein [Chryseolinea lacunae]|uniref:hypothetical protein n=1 Tax=Chryseolinea lacunae TaxID=2801331 RepID=UPI003F6F3D22
MMDVMCVTCFRLQSGVFVFGHQPAVSLFDGKIALIKTKEIATTVACFRDVGEVGKVKPFELHFFGTHFGFAHRVKGFENAPVSAKHQDDGAHVDGFFPVETIVVLRAALIVTKFFIQPAPHFGAALKAVSGILIWHITLALQTTVNEYNRN